MGFGALRLCLLIGVLHGAITIVAGICEGVCVKMDECENTFGGINVVDLRWNDADYVEADCPHYLEICCDLDHVVTTRAPPVSTEVPPAANRTDGKDEGTGPTPVTTPVPTPVTTPVPTPVPTPVTQPPPVTEPPKYFKECGQRNPEGIGFRLSSSPHNETQFGEFPWMMAILQKFSEEDSDAATYECGGSLVAPNVVLTAAHCVMDKQESKLKVRAGEWDALTTNEYLAHQERPVSRIIFHPNFNRELLFHNLALLVVDSPFEPADNVQLACLPPQDKHFTDDNCFAAGWGKSAFDSKNYHVILKRVPLPMVDRAQCQSALRTTRLGPRFRLHESYICAGGVEGIDTCTGDGGSPLVCPIAGTENRYQQVGIVAWGINCAQGGVPGVYVRTSLYTDWIANELWNNYYSKYNEVLN